MDDDHLLAHYDSQVNWTRARRKALGQKMLCALKSCPADLMPFEEVRRRLRLTQKVYRGIAEIDIDHIRGSVGRYADFTSAFFPRRKHDRQRWETVNRLTRLDALPPIDVYRVGEAFFVVDGNHRVSNARIEGIRTITANVCEFVAPVRLSADADLNEVIVKSEQMDFLSRTQLDRLRPDAEIVFTAAGRYPELECVIEAYRESMQATRGRPIPFEEALLLWYDSVYLIAAEQITQSGVLGRFPGRSVADLFMWIWEHQNRLVQTCGRGPLRRTADTVSRILRRFLGLRGSGLKESQTGSVDDVTQ